jgi:hypothetical protein
MVVAALDDIDGIDLDIAEMANHGGGGVRSRSEGLSRIEPLRAQPDAPGLRLAQGKGYRGSHAANLAGFAPPRRRPRTEKPRCPKAAGSAARTNESRSYFIMLIFCALM